jgi:hypothetical protein
MDKNERVVEKNNLPMNALRQLPIRTNVEEQIIVISVDMVRNF